MSRFLWTAQVPDFNYGMRKSFLRKIALTLCTTLAIAGCHRSQMADPAVRYYEARGMVRGFAPDRSAVDIEHEEVPGLMPSMTMPFAVKDEKEIAALKVGDAISFRMIVTDKDLLLDHVKKIAANDVRVAMHTPAPRTSPDASTRLREGDAMPPFSLTDQDGKQVTLETFHGQPFVLTFVFTRCPIPNFCPLMSKHFAELQIAIKNSSGSVAQTRLLSISFDPDFDSPQVLKDYAKHEQADSNIWSFATGRKSEIDDLTHAFSVYVQTEGGSISHGLATALIDREGKIIKIWRGNGWAPAEVISEINAHGASL